MAHFRESNAVFLEVLEPPIAEGVPIELDIFDGASPATLLATLEGAKDIALQQELNKPGSASFRINRHDPKATSAIVDRENLAKLKVGGKYRFAFWMRERKIEVLQEGEEEAEYWSIGGPGALQYVDRGEMWTVSYLGDNPIEGVWDLGNAFGGNSVGQMARRVIDEQLAKTPSPMGLLTTNWTYDVDSQGNAWSDSADLEVNVGDNVLDVLGLLTGLGLDIRMRHDLLLEAFVELGRHYDVASAPELPVVFRGGQNITTSLTRRSQGGIASRALVKGAGDAVVEVVRPDIEADPYVGRREIFLSVSNAKDATTMQRAGEAELSGRLADTEAISFGVAHGTGPGEYEPWVHYDIGDWITLDETGVYDLASYRIVGWSIKQVEDDYEIFLDCNSVEYEDLLKLARKAGLDGAGGSTGGSSTVGAGGGGGGSTASSSKVAVELGDTAGYLYDKLLAGSGIVKSLAGVAGSRKVEISLGALALALDSLTDVDTTTTPPTDGQALVFDSASGLWKPGTVGGGGGGGGWALVLDENGSSLANWQEHLGDWTTDGVQITSPLAPTNQRLRYTTKTPHGGGLVYEAEFFFPTAGQGTGVDVGAGLVVGTDASMNPGGLAVQFFPNRALTVQVERSEQLAIVSFAAAVPFDAWNKLRILTGGVYTSVYANGVLIGTGRTDASGLGDLTYLGLRSYNSLVHFRNIKAWTPVLPA